MPIFVKKLEKVAFLLKKSLIKFGWLRSNAYLCIRFWGLTPISDKNKRSLEDLHRRQVVQEAAPPAFSEVVWRG